MWRTKHSNAPTTKNESLRDESQPQSPVEKQGSLPTPQNRKLPAPLNYYGKQIEELLLKVIRIERACLGDNEDDSAEYDEFVSLKKEMYGILFQTKNLIREKYEIQSSKGNTVDAIVKGSQVDKNIHLLGQHFLTLKEVFKKQTKKVNRNKEMAWQSAASSQRISPEELDVRFKEMQVLKKQIDECTELLKRGTEYTDTEIIELTDFVKQMENAGLAPPPQFDNGNGGQWREPTAEEQATLNRWSARDQDFDRQIWEVGEVVDRLNVIATEIGNKAEEQGRMALDLSRQADEANAEVIEVNTKLKELVLSGNGLNFCCKLLLTLILISMLGFISQNVSMRIKKGVGLARRMDSLPARSISSEPHYDDPTPPELVQLAVQGIASGSRLSFQRFAKTGLLILTSPATFEHPDGLSRIAGYATHQNLRRM